MIKLSKIFLTLWCIGTIFSSHALHEFEEQIRAASKVPHIAAALAENQEAKEVSISEMNKVVRFIHERSAGVSVETFLGNLRSRLEKERDHLRFIGDICKPLPAGAKATWSLKTHKMTEAVEDFLSEKPLSAEHRYLSEENVSRLFAGEHLFDPSLTEESFPAVLGKGFWGTTQGTRYPLFLLAVAAELMNPTGKTPVTALDVLAQAEINIDNSPIAHIVPLPANLSNWNDYLRNSLFFVPEYADGKAGFLQTHTGFLFGGHRNVDETSSLEPRYPKGKKYGPEDCSSSVAKFTRYPHVIATLYQWLFWESYQNPGNYQQVLDQLTAEQVEDIQKRVRELSTHYIAIPVEEIQLGDVIGWRTLKEGSPLGIGGHTGIYLGLSSKGNPLFLGPNRGLPQTQMDGFGLEEKVKPESAVQFGMRLKA